jgi:hypothetical protein
MFNKTKLIIICVNIYIYIYIYIYILISIEKLSRKNILRENKHIFFVIGH